MEVRAALAFSRAAREVREGLVRRLVAQEDKEGSVCLEFRAGREGPVPTALPGTLMVAKEALVASAHPVEQAGKVATATVTATVAKEALEVREVRALLEERPAAWGGRAVMVLEMVREVTEERVVKVVMDRQEQAAPVERGARVAPALPAATVALEGKEATPRKIQQAMAAREATEVALEGMRGPGDCRATGRGSRQVVGPPALPPSALSGKRMRELCF